MESALLLGHSADWWNGVMLLSLGIAAFVAAFVAVATTGAVIAAKRETATAKLRIATLEDSTAKARAEAERVKGLVIWRSVDPSSISALVAALSHAGGSITFAYVQNDPEAINFTISLENIFNDANGAGNWHLEAQPRMYTDRNVFGLYIFGKDSSALDAVKAAFTSANIKFIDERMPTPVTQIGGMTTQPGEPTTDVVIMVGSRYPTL